MRFPIEKFRQFCDHLVLNSKEFGRVRFTWNGSQKRFIDQLARWLDKDVHQFVVLKARQLGITTIALGLDLFWLFSHKGMQGAIAVPAENVRDLSRNILTSYLDSLPRGLSWPTTISNRTELRFGNNSRLAYLIAGGRNSGALARGQGLNFLHATEMSSWGDDEGVVSLQASLAERNPDRLFVFESTARGFNVFHEMWEDACRSKTTAPVFIGWWANELYTIPESSPLFPTYGGARMSREEKRWAHEVKKLYGVDLSREQWAWWRWKWAEKDHSRLLLAEFPFTAEQAFVMTGNEFYPIERLQAIYKAAQDAPRECWSYTIGKRFEETRIERDDDGALSVWEEPVAGARYVVAADPAYGESEWSDAFCVQVLRCGLDGAVQVAEFNSPDCTMYGFAWIIAHLAGAYSSPNIPATVILELGGPGRAVLQELNRMPSQYGAAMPGLSADASAELANIFGSIQHYLYRRPDTLSGSRLLQWETTYRTKGVMMNLSRDLMERGYLTINSPEWVEEARYVTQNGTSIKAEGRTHKDDRVIALALACVAWQDQVLPEIAVGGADADLSVSSNPVARSVGGWLKAIQDRNEDELQHATGGASWQE